MQCPDPETGNMNPVQPPSQQTMAAQPAQHTMVMQTGVPVTNMPIVQGVPVGESGIEMPTVQGIPSQFVQPHMYGNFQGEWPSGIVMGERPSPDLVTAIPIVDPIPAGIPYGQYGRQAQTMTAERSFLDHVFGMPTLGIGELVSGEGSDNAAEDPTLLALFVCVCCCWLTGLIAIARSREVVWANCQGDFGAAHHKRREAMKMIYISAVIGIMLHLLYFVSNVGITRH